MIIKEFNFFRSKSNTLKDVYDRVKNDPEFSNVEMVDKKDNEHINFDFKKIKMSIMSDSISVPSKWVVSGRGIDNKLELRGIDSLDDIKNQTIKLSNTLLENELVNSKFLEFQSHLSKDDIIDLSSNISDLTTIEIKDCIITIKDNKKNAKYIITIETPKYLFSDHLDNLKKYSEILSESADFLKRVKSGWSLETEYSINDGFLIISIYKPLSDKYHRNTLS